MNGTRRLSVAVTLLVVVSVLSQVAAGAIGDVLGKGDRSGFSPGGMLLALDDNDLGRDLDVMAASGAKWVRVDFAWSWTEATRGTFNWSGLDRVVNAVHARNMRVLALPGYTPQWARPPGAVSDKTPPVNPADFATFVTAAVRRYAPTGVKTWEIWNEPNLGNFWAPKPDPLMYTALLKVAYTAVKTVDPTATVLSGGLSPGVDAPDGSQFSPFTFLERVYQAGGKGSFDAAAIHPYSFPARPMDASTAEWNTFFRLPLLRDVMVRYGDSAKQIWSTEMGAPTGTGSAAVSEAEQAAIVAEAYAAVDQWPWAGPMLWYSVRDAGTDPVDREQNFGLLRYDRAEKPAMGRFRTAMTAPPPPTSTTSPPPPTTSTTRATTTTQATASTAAPAATTVGPSAVTVNTGKAGTTGVSAMTADDNVRWSVTSTTASTRTTTWTLSFSGVPNAVSALSATWRASATRSCTRVVSAMDFVRNVWVTVDSRGTTTTESQVADKALAGTARDFVSGTTGPGEVRLRVKCTSKVASFREDIDLFRVSYRP